MAPRLPTTSEWNSLSSSFPGLTQANVWITDAPTPVYNCIAFSLGRTDIWINPPQPLATFQALYNGVPYNHPTAPVVAPGAAIDGWSLPSEMTHGSRVNTANKPGLWESKLGSSYRITHGRPELSGNVYGQIVTSFN